MEYVEMVIHRIVLTGSVCAGKTTAMSYLYDRLSGLGFRVYLVPEVARLVFSGGVSHTQFADQLDLQKALLSAQFSMEETFLDLAKASDASKVIILYDRGALDVKAFTDDSAWEALFSELDETMVELRDVPYEAVIHMQTAAIGAEHAYVNDDVRKETPEQAIALDKRIMDAWTGHPHLIIIPNKKDGLDGKLKRTLAAVLKTVGHPIPTEIERKYLVRDYQQWPLRDAQVVEIEQHYLKEPGQRIRKRGQQGSYVYTFCEKKPTANPMERMEIERQITAREYLDFMNSRDPDLKMISKNRSCFVYENQYFELDVFKGHMGGLVLLEVELGSLDQVVYLPPFIDIHREVTDSGGYSNRALARCSIMGQSMLWDIDINPLHKTERD